MATIPPVTPVHVASSSMPLSSTGAHPSGFQSTTFTMSATSSESLPASSSSTLPPSNSSAVINTATPTVQVADQGSPTSHHRLVSIMIPVMITTLSLVAIIITVIIMIRRRRRRKGKVDDGPKVMPYNLPARRAWDPDAAGTSKQELKKGREMVPTMPDEAQAQSERIPVAGGLIGEAEIRDRMVVSDGDGQLHPEQNVASGSHAPLVSIAMRLDEIERQMQSLQTADITQNQIGGNITSAEMLATIQRLLVEMNRPPPEYSSALHEGNNG